MQKKKIERMKHPGRMKIERQVCINGKNKLEHVILESQFEQFMIVTAPFIC
jgi:hypothetical protein